MLVVLVHVHVKKACIDAFKEASIENARRSIQEPGIARFDVIQQSDDPAQFVLVEAYRSEEAPAAHRQTAHYERWRAAVADMMAEDRIKFEYANVFPGDNGWG